MAKRREDVPPRLPGELELAILDVLWRRGAANAGEVREALAGERDLAYSTVLTVLRRLEEKRLLTRRKVSRGHVYEPAIDRDAVERGSVRELVGRVFRGSAADLLARLVDDDGLTAEELERIEDLVLRRRSERDRR